ncbi:MAG: hypothetical protein GX425_04530, partial [Peptococcaceae bacterium]|nr:hypothetical protein [Peptococcaceae bacterium]
MRGKGNSLLLMAIIGLFFMGLSLYFTVNYAQASGSSAPDATNLYVGAAVNDAITNPGEARWFKITPPESMIRDATHFKFETSGNLDTYIRVYIDLQNAMLDKPSYTDDDDGTGTNALVEIPIAYNGPFYIKVTALGNATGLFGIGASTLNNPPGDYPGSGPCAAESAVSDRPSGLQMLANMYAVRDGLLTKTTAGKRIIDLYYRSSPYLIKGLVKDENFRNALYESLLQFQPFLEQAIAVGNGTQSNYVITEQDYKNIVGMRALIEPWLPDNLRSELNSLWEGMGVSSFSGEELRNCFVKTGLYTDKKTPYLTDELVIKLKSINNQSSENAEYNPGLYLTALNQKLSAYGVKSIKPLGLPASANTANNGLIERTFLVKLYSGYPDTLALAGELSKLPEVEYAEPNYIMNALTEDVYFNYQWPLLNTGQNGGIAGD